MPGYEPETSAENVGIQFDHDGDMIQHPSGWVKGHTGILVLDRNGDGLIDNGGELFGSHTLKYDDGTLCQNAFEALRQEDTNKDSMVNHLDDNWSHLRLWLYQGDLMERTMKLHTLEEFNITGIKVADAGAAQVVPGGTLTGKGLYVLADGSGGNIWQFEYDQNTFYRKFMDEIEVPLSVDLMIPGIRGSGVVRDLKEAVVWELNGNSLTSPPDGKLAFNTPLRQAVTAYMTAETEEAKRRLVDEVLYAWAKTSGMPEMDERYAGLYTVVHKDTPEDVTAWKRKLYILEAFTGQYFFDSPIHWSIKIKESSKAGVLPTMVIYWHSNQTDPLNSAYEGMINNFYKGSQR